MQRPRNSLVDRYVRFSTALLAAMASFQGANRGAQAATLYTGNNFNVEASFLVPVSANLRAFTLIAVGKNGAQPRVFDSSKSGQGGTGITTTENRIHQVWEGGFVPTPTLNLVVPGSIPQSIDSHFLVDNSSLFITQLPAENRPIADPTLNPSAGYGNSLTGAFALVGAVGSSWNIAYLVVPAGTTLNFSFELGAAGVASEQVMTSLAMTFTLGDGNMDGLINIFDINLISSNWGSAGPAGDVNGDGIVNVFDINLTATNWSPTSSSPAFAATPEPGTLILAALGLLALAIRSAAFAQIRLMRSAVVSVSK